MIGWLIIACEIGFWVFVLAGLIARYVFKKKKLGALLLICTPIVDIILLAATVADLKNGAVATTVHGVAAVYIGISAAYGHQLIQWADERFAYWFVHGQKPVSKKKYGVEHARKERKGWYRHVLAWMIGGVLIGAIILFVNNISQTEALFRTLQLWSFVLVIDFFISFSYTLMPRKENGMNV
ncbi:putative membrane protein YmcC [Halobacillus andaensis]|uniref:Membrane protein YmcC n=1 Tax=Halobacillus andaensis TaxID=1176239 RepID=A0A917EUD8_HALAA|nr:hypothetical protein [Halobacillus andaensis]MBP2003813.1 uncharacterized membrane protein YraQ (UPF0718 family) [Halobacillus andaensis]GGF13444.1 putative membrane protein YmcC [Halobacillus andaensis]